MTGQAELGVTYWICVYGYADAGEFAITVYEGKPVGGFGGTASPVP